MDKRFLDFVSKSNFGTAPVDPNDQLLDFLAGETEVNPQIRLLVGEPDTPIEEITFEVGPVIRDTQTDEDVVWPYDEDNSNVISLQELRGPDIPGITDPSDYNPDKQLIDFHINEETEGKTAKPPFEAIAEVDRQQIPDPKDVGPLIDFYTDQDKDSNTSILERLGEKRKDIINDISSVFDKAGVTVRDLWDTTKRGVEEVDEIRNKLAVDLATVLAKAGLAGKDVWDTTKEGVNERWNQLNKEVKKALDIAVKVHRNRNYLNAGYKYIEDARKSKLFELENNPLHWPDTFRGKPGTPFEGYQISYYPQPDHPILKDPRYAKYYNPDKAGQIDDETPLMGTYDYSAPGTNAIGHLIFDVISHGLDRKYTPGLTEELNIEDEPLYIPKESHSPADFSWYGP